MPAPARQDSTPSWQAASSTASTATSCSSRPNATAVWCTTRCCRAWRLATCSPSRAPGSPARPARRPSRRPSCACPSEIRNRRRHLLPTVSSRSSLICSRFRCSVRGDNLAPTKVVVPVHKSKRQDECSAKKSYVVVGGQQFEWLQVKEKRREGRWHSGMCLAACAGTGNKAYSVSRWLGGWRSTAPARCSSWRTAPP